MAKNGLTEGDFISVKVDNEEAPMFGVYVKTQACGPGSEYRSIELVLHDDGIPRRISVPGVFFEGSGNRYGLVRREEYVIHLKQCMDALDYRKTSAIYPVSADWNSRMGYLDSLIKRIESGEQI